MNIETNELGDVPVVNICFMAVDSDVLYLALHQDVARLLTS